MKKTEKNQQNLASNSYDPAMIEPKWQSKWANEGIYHCDLDFANSHRGNEANHTQPFYNLMMFPYPSAEGMHAGNFFTFTGADTYGRFKRMQGYNVFEPIGLDGFGIHSENYAIKVGSHPVEQSEKSEENFYRQFRATGNMFDFKRRVETYKPDYYKWTQWIFTQLFKAGLAYRKKSPVNFCPGCKTVLADEQVIDTKCERCSSVVVKKNLEQWFFRITEYADRLLANIEGLDWTEKVKIAQKNWIGRSEGARIEFKIQNSELKVEVFTTAIDTIYGVTFMVISPEHALVPQVLDLIHDEKKKDEIKKYINEAKNKSDIERQGEGKEKTGVATGLYVINPFNNKEVPLWVADYVLAGYGTGAVMGVPGHDARDHAFAKKFGLQIKPVVKPQESVSGAKVEPDGFWDYPEIKKVADKSMLFDSGDFNGLNSAQAKAKMLEFIKEKGFGEKTTTYHLRDWLISRQRYWGPPIPMVYCPKCAGESKSWFDTQGAKSPHREISNIKSQISNKKEIGKLDPPAGRGNSSETMAGWYPVQDDQLPVELPYIKDFKPLGTGNSPLGNHPEFYKVACPHCGANARRETDVSDTFLDSSWYFLRYLATDRDDIPFPSVELARSKKQEAIRSASSGQASKEDIRNLELEIGNSAQRLAWLPVTMYIGGAEHSVLHLLYARFITMFFKDQGLIEFEEPFKRFYAHGLIIKDGAKMSKSKGNIINPDEYIRKYGVDTLRMYLRFLAPFNQDGDFRDSGIEGMNRFIKRVWNLFSSQLEIGNWKLEIPEENLRVMHQAIKLVTEEMEELRFNTAIAHLMTWYNFLSKQAQISTEEVEVYLKLLAPLAPHMAEELYQSLRDSQNHAELKTQNNAKRSGVVSRKVSRSSALDSIHTSPWPEYDEIYLVTDIVKIPVQVNGKLRHMIEVDAEKVNDEEKIKSLAMGHNRVAPWLMGKPIKKFIYVPGKIVNFVVE